MPAKAAALTANETHRIPQRGKSDPKRQRLPAEWLPRQHGAWAMLFLPFGLLTLATAWPLATGAVFWSSFVLAVAVHVGIALHVRRALTHAPRGAAT